MDNTRDKGGRFIKGHPGGPGNPLAARVTALKNSLLNAVHPDDVSAIVRRLVELCHNEDKKTSLDAMTLFFNRVYGKPTESINLDVAKPEIVPPAPVKITLTPEEQAIVDKLLARSM